MGVHIASHIQEVNQMGQYIRAVLAEKTFCLRGLCIFVNTSPINIAGASGNGKRYFSQKLQVQIANNSRSPQSQPSMQQCTWIHIFPIPLIFRYYLPLNNFLHIPKSNIQYCKSISGLHKAKVKYLPPNQRKQ